MVKQHLFSVVEKILWKAALVVTGRDDNASKLVMDKPALALAVRKSRRAVYCRESKAWISLLVRSGVPSASTPLALPGGGSFPSISTTG